MFARRLLLVIFVVIAAASSRADEALKPVDVRDVKLDVGGSLGHRLDLTVQKNILAIDHEKSFLRYFREKKRPGFSYVGLGKEIDALVRLAYYTQDPKLVELKNQVVRETIATQLPDGYIGIFGGNRLNIWWDVHEMSYVIFGLVQDYRYFGDKDALAAARRAGDYMIAHRPERKLVYHVSTIGLERAMLALNSATGEAKYLTYANFQDSLTDWQPQVGGHTYDFLNLCLAQMDLYDRRNDSHLLGQSHRTMDFLTANNGLLVDGTCSLGEGWHTNQVGTGNAGESCVTSYLIRLWDRLLRAEDNPVYGDLMERAIYNALFAAQSPDGRELRKYTPQEGARSYYQGEPSSDFQRDTYCCPNNFRRAIADLPGLVYYHTDKALIVNLYTASQATIPLTKELKVKIKQETTYPTSGDVRLLVQPSSAAEFALKLRIPRWCADASVKVNGQPADGTPKAGEYFSIARTWKEGDTVDLKLPMSVRLVRGRASQANKVAVMRGPLLFCFDPVLNMDQEAALGAEHGEPGQQRRELIEKINGVKALLAGRKPKPDPKSKEPPKPIPDRQTLLEEKAKLEHELAGRPTVADILKKITFDLGSISRPEKNGAAEPEGLALRIKAWGVGADRSAPPNRTFLLTEFADPGGELTYFPTTDPQLGVDDELVHSPPPKPDAKAAGAKPAPKAK